MMGAHERKEEIMKVYAIIYDYQDYEEWVVGIFSTREKADEFILNEYKKSGHIDKELFLDGSEYSLVEWELDTNKKREVKIRL